MYKKFEKWHGCKNDFIIMYTSDHESEMVKNSLIKLAPRFCAKDGDGIGADGVLLLQTKLPDDPLPYKLTIINSDGTIALNCGNGLRVAALSSRKRSLELDPVSGPCELVSLQVEGKDFHCRFSESSSKAAPYVNVDMGVAVSNDELSWHKDSVSRMKAFADEHGLAFSKDDVSSTDLGNPHIVWKLDEASRPLLHKVGPKIQDFFDGGGINLHLVKEEEITSDDQSQAVIHTGKKITERYTMFCWERGAGPTQACGSGATSVGAASLCAGFLSEDEWIAVDMPGGRVYISKDSATGHMVLCGPGKFIFEGTIEI
ncbi:diaminopimelate epimerase [bacterium]|nr:diaminopimelate epimerase [bacterium]